jgi:hypothetical protein
VVIGLGLGAFGAVVAGIVAPNSDTLKLFTTAVSAALGAAGGAISTMVADRRRDRLTFRRKTKASTLRIERLRLQYETLIRQITLLAHLTDGQVKAVDESDEALRPVLLLTLLLRGLTAAAGQVPAFDDILETDEDAGNALHAEELFSASVALQYFDSAGEGAPDLDDAKRNVLLCRRLGFDEMMRDRMETLARIKAHFEKKLDPDA